MGSTSKRSKEKGNKKKKKRERSRSKSKERDKHHRHHHKRKKRRRVREEKSLSLSDLSSDSDFNLQDNSDNEIEREDLPDYVVPPPSQPSKLPHSMPHPPREEYVEPAKSSGNNESSLSVEETNKLRAKMGLKPLKVSPQVVSYDNQPDDDVYVAGQEVHRPPENLRDKLQVEKLRNKIAAQKEKRRLTEKMKRVKGLGDSDGDEDVDEWVKKSRKAELDRREAEKRNKMMEELDAQFGVGDIVEEEIRQEKKKMYDTRNLSGMKVQHDTTRFGEGSSVILTLKDSNILEHEEDSLVNVNLEDAERTEKNVRNRLKKKKDEEDPFDEIGKDLLDKYDEEIEGERKKSFRIGRGGQGTVSQLTPAQTQASKMDKLRQMTTLDRPDFQLATEYMTGSEATSKFKKVKKKRKKKMLKADDLLPIENGSAHLGHRGMTREENEQVLGPEGPEQVKSIRQLIEEDDAERPEPMEVEDRIESESEQDDLELQEAITRSRRANEDYRRNLELNPIDHLARATTSVGDLKPSVNAIDLLKPYPTVEENPNMTLNLTDEFCRTLGEIPTYGLSGNRADEDAILVQDDLMQAKPTWEKQSGAWEEVGIDDSKVEIGDDKNAAILEEEPDTQIGVMNALKLAIKKGYLDKSKTKKTSNATLQHLKAINYSIDDKVVEDDRRGGGHHHRYNGPTMDFREKESYRPDVKLDYVDDEGRKLSEKEAFRYLSHKFHGKGSSKNKLEKRMKKWQEELLMKNMSSSDTPLQTLERQREKQKSMGTPYLVLTGAKQEILDVKK